VHFSLDVWTKGSVIRGWLIELMASQHRRTKGLRRVPSYVDDTGEVNWLVEDALRLEVPIPVIAQSVMQLLESREGSRAWARSIAVMRQGFGGHRPGRLSRRDASAGMAAWWRTGKSRRIPSVALCLPPTVRINANRPSPDADRVGWNAPATCTPGSAVPSR